MVGKDAHGFHQLVDEIAGKPKDDWFSRYMAADHYCKQLERRLMRLAHTNEDLARLVVSLNEKIREMNYDLVKATNERSEA